MLTVAQATSKHLYIRDTNKIADDIQIHPSNNFIEVHFTLLDSTELPWYPLTSQFLHQCHTIAFPLPVHYFLFVFFKYFFTVPSNLTISYHSVLCHLFKPEPFKPSLITHCKLRTGPLHTRPFPHSLFSISCETLSISLMISLASHLVYSIFASSFFLQFTPNNHQTTTRNNSSHPYP